MELGQTRRDRREREGGSADRERETAFAVVTYFSTMTIYYLFVTEQILDKHQTRRGSIIQYRCRFSLFKYRGTFLLLSTVTISRFCKIAKFHQVWK